MVTNEPKSRESDGSAEIVEGPEIDLVREELISEEDITGPVVAKEHDQIAATIQKDLPAISPTEASKSPDKKAKPTKVFLCIQHFQELGFDFLPMVKQVMTFQWQGRSLTNELMAQLLIHLFSEFSNNIVSTDFDENKFSHLNRIRDILRAVPTDESCRPMYEAFRQQHSIKP